MSSEHTVKTGENQGKLIVVSGPSGVGKGTILQRLFDLNRFPLVSSVSATTRLPRPGETDGVNYHFFTPEQFDQLRQDQAFLECFQVFHGGHWYGTLKAEVDQALNAGKWVVLEIDVNGAQEVMKKYPQAISVFIQPPDWKTLEERLIGRGTEDSETQTRRLRQARRELEQAELYRYQLVNDQLDQTVQELAEILEQASD